MFLCPDRLHWLKTLPTMFTFNALPRHFFFLTWSTINIFDVNHCAISKWPCQKNYIRSQFQRLLAVTSHHSFKLSLEYKCQWRLLGHTAATLPECGGVVAGRYNTDCILLWVVMGTITANQNRFDVCPNLKWKRKKSNPTYYFFFYMYAAMSVIFLIYKIFKKKKKDCVN